MVDSLGGQVQADSGRFELKQIPGGIPVRSGGFTEFTSIAQSMPINQFNSPISFVSIHLLLQGLLKKHVDW